MIRRVKLGVPPKQVIMEEEISIFRAFWIIIKNIWKK